MYIDCLQLEGSLSILPELGSGFQTSQPLPDWSCGVIPHQSQTSELNVRRTPGSVAWKMAKHPLQPWMRRVIF